MKCIALQVMRNEFQLGKSASTAYYDYSLQNPDQSRYISKQRACHQLYAERSIQQNQTKNVWVVRILEETQQLGWGDDYRDHRKLN